MKLKKLLCTFLGAALFMINTLPLCASAYSFTPYTNDDEGGTVPIKIYSESVYMVNTDTGDVLVDINSDEKRVPASLTKIMTAVVLLEKYKDNPEDLKTDMVSAGSEAFDELYGTGASTADIRPDEVVSYYDLLCALLIPSACEAGNIIALNISDSLEHFCDLMNKEAKILGMNDSHFSNAHGLFSNQNYSTCKDLYKLAKYAYDTFPVFREIVAMPACNLDPTDEHPDGTLIINTNEMLDETSEYYYSPVKGIKTGTTDEAGRCLISCASMDGKNYMIVSMGAPLYRLDEEKEEAAQKKLEEEQLQAQIEQAQNGGEQQSEEQTTDDGTGYTEQPQEENTEDYTDEYTEWDDGTGEYTEEYAVDEYMSGDSEQTGEQVMYSMIDHKHLYQWAFYHLVSTDFINTNSEIVDVKVEFAAKSDTVNLRPAEGFKREWPDNIKLSEVKQKIDLKENIVAPVYKGDALGTLSLYYKDEKIASVDLVAATSLERDDNASRIRVAKSFTSSAQFKLCVAFIVIMFIGYSSWFVYTLQHKYVRKGKPDSDEDEEE
ncbi:MAG: D-alanyl-D-alanine carboxypeptidase [Ruminococcus sp.]|nr:D-alanyl-D-alanine carboxypeptidase [Ruminococcus sp.]